MESSRETHKRIIAQRIAAVVADAARLGLVVTVELTPGTPLAMGNYHTKIDVRDNAETRKKADGLR